MKTKNWRLKLRKPCSLAKSEALLFDTKKEAKKYRKFLGGRIEKISNVVEEVVIGSYHYDAMWEECYD